MDSERVEGSGKGCKVRRNAALSGCGGPRKSFGRTRKAHLRRSLTEHPVHNETGRGYWALTPWTTTATEKSTPATAPSANSRAWPSLASKASTPPTCRGRSETGRKPDGVKLNLFWIFFREEHPPWNLLRCLMCSSVFFGNRVVATVVTWSETRHGTRGETGCLNCAETFTPQARNARHQRYRGLAPSKRASQAKWLAKPENRDCRRGTQAAGRVPATAGARRWLPDS